MASGLWAITTVIVLYYLLKKEITMALRQSTLDIIAKIEALKNQPVDDGITQATVDAAVAERQAIIDADIAEDAENVDAINAALDASPVTPNASEV